MLLFAARQFRWRPSDGGEGGDVADAVVAFVHVEPEDVARPARSLRRAAKWLKWYLRKRGRDTVALHSFAHLGGRPATPEAARAWLEETGRRLAEAGYRVTSTPFGVSCGWILDCEPDGGAKVYLSTSDEAAGHGACGRKPDRPRHPDGDPSTGRRP